MISESVEQSNDCTKFSTCADSLSRKLTEWAHELMKSLEVFTGFSTWQPQYGITFNQFLIADERSALISYGHARFARPDSQRHSRGA